MPFFSHENTISLPSQARDKQKGNRLNKGSVCLLRCIIYYVSMGWRHPSASFLVVATASEAVWSPRAGSDKLFQTNACGPVSRHQCSSVCLCLCTCLYACARACACACACARVSVPVPASMRVFHGSKLNISTLCRVLHVVARCGRAAAPALALGNSPSRPSTQSSIR